MWSVLIRQLHYVSWKPGLLTFIAVLAARGQLAELFFKSSSDPGDVQRDKGDPETTGERAAVNMLQSFPAVWSKVPCGLCPCLGTISYLLLLQTRPWFFLTPSRITLEWGLCKRPLYHQKFKFLLTFYWLTSTLQASILVIITVWILDSLCAAFTSRCRVGKRWPMLKDKTGQDRHKPTQSFIPGRQSQAKLLL